MRDQSQSLLPCEEGGKTAWVLPWDFFGQPVEPGGGGSRSLVTWPCLAQVPKAAAQKRVGRALTQDRDG